MKLTYIALAATLALAINAGPCKAADVPVITKAIVISGPIMDNVTEQLGDALLLSSNGDNPDPIDIVISSPGGSVEEGFLFIAKMEAAKAKGAIIRCYVPDLAASMAFQIFTHCSERYALPTAFLLWHHARTQFGGGFGGGPALTAGQLLHAGQELADLDKLILDEVIAAFGSSVSKATIQYHFDTETLHTALQVRRIAPDFLTVLPSISGLQEVLYVAKHQKKVAPPSPFGRRPGNRPYHIIYVAPPGKLPSNVLVPEVSPAGKIPGGVN